MPAKRKLPRSKQSWIELSRNFVKQWPEVLEGMALTNMPIGYVEVVTVTQKNGISIAFNIRKLSKANSEPKVAKILQNYIKKNFKKIKMVDLTFNIKKLKYDMNNKTQAVLSKSFK
tara:strand:- start:310 stop:657 length:348 start_codon:yes stop_codon:yes gene_type:complete